eukprot:gnl/Dysnectes_brevis/7235_a11948_298.p1 GENE.gnl/Dysnectes_brevis/7235_a11948_298~~gnl/Dysnectes_brevis/7235_a11948_298.p1  ORF type:complete len:295 (+),score=-8.91 gnl/Dysnectes_brevis/7235_a11948_298:45-929(+)
MPPKRRIKELTDESAVKIAKNMIIKLKSHFAPMPPIRDGDWLDEHDEKGQTLSQYISRKPVRPLGKRSIINILLIGSFTDLQLSIIDITIEYMKVFFCRQVEVLDHVSSSIVPSTARRFNDDDDDDSHQHEQLLTKWILKYLKTRLPHSAACLIAFSAMDLYPRPSWNFVYGQASLKGRVGVWSIYRNGDPETEYQLVLKRTLQTGVHETAHMFTFKHCIYHGRCGMRGANGRDESDYKSLHFCRICAAKLCFCLRERPVGRYRRLAVFYEKYGFEDELKKVLLLAKVLSTRKK